MKKFVLHLEDSSDEKLHSALCMLHNFDIQAHTEDYHAVLLITGQAVKHFTTDAPEHDEILSLLTNRKISVKLCRNALSHQQISEKDISDDFAVVPAGIYELVSLQNNGYAYIKC